jgi:phosphate transport system protein
MRYIAESFYALDQGRSNDGTDNMPRNHTVKSYDDDLDGIVRAILAMGRRAEAQVADALAALRGVDREAAERIAHAEPRLDSDEEAVDQMAVRLFALRQPMAQDLRLVAMSLKISNDLERIGDYAASVAKRADRIAPAARALVTPSLVRLGEGVREMLAEVLDAYADRDADRAMRVWHRDGEVDDLYKRLSREFVDGVVADPTSTSACVDLLFVAKNFERIGDHATNIAERVHYIVHGDRINRVRGEAPIAAAAGD